MARVGLLQRHGEPAVMQEHGLTCHSAERSVQTLFSVEKGEKVLL